MEVDAFHFLRPVWLVALLPVLALGWWWVRRTQSGSGWEQRIDAQLLSVLLDDQHRKSSRVVAWGLWLGLLVTCVGLAGPTWQKLPQSVEQKEDTLVVLLDLSLSMLAEDVKPSRIERARQEITDILRTRDEGQTALVAYAGDAHAVVPLTDDANTIENLLFSLSPEMMPVFGSNPDHALQLAHELLTNGRTLQGRILIVTDGIDAISSVSRHAHPAFPISILGIGTQDGAAVPLDKLRQPGRFLQTQEGNQVIALLDEQRLRDVASLTHGRYARAALGDADIAHLLSTPLPGEDETIEVEREFDTWFDQGHWAALLLLPLLLLAFRRGVLLGAALALLPWATGATIALATLGAGQVHAVSGPTAAVESLGTTLTEGWKALWQRSDQRGFDKLRHGEPEKAAALFEDPNWRAVAQYRSGDYATSLQGFSQNDTPRNLYNRGNALARLGEYANAITAYDAVLATQPDHEDAAFNKALVERLLQEQQQAEQEQNQEQESQANNQDSESQQNQQNEAQDQSEQSEQDESQEQNQQSEDEQQQQDEQQGEQREAESEEDEASRDERQEALEQWLRRVPDDPGGLLRRKFSHETKQRLRRGEYENRQQEKVW